MTYVYVTSILFIVCCLPLAITSIAMGAVHWNQCRASVQSSTPVSLQPASPTSAPYFIYTPDSNPIITGAPKNMLNIWLIVYGSVFLAMTAGQVCVLCLWDYDSKSPRIFSLLFNLLWHIAWIIVGGIFLFTSTGKTCHHSVNKGGYRVWQTALGMWILCLMGIPGLLVTMCAVSEQ